MSVRGLRMFLKGEEGLTRERDDVRWLAEERLGS